MSPKQPVSGGVCPITGQGWTRVPSLRAHSAQGAPGRGKVTAPYPEGEEQGELSSTLLPEELSSI